MNMALRPFSHLLLLLLVMIPAIAPDDNPLADVDLWPDTQCHRVDVFFCFSLLSETEALPEMTRTTNDLPNDGIKMGGIMLDSRYDDHWIITFDYTFDTKFPGPDCQNYIVTTKTTILSCLDIYNQINIPKFGINKGVGISPWRFNDHKEILQYNLTVNPGLYVADELGLFANPEMKLLIHKKVYVDLMNIKESSHSPAHAFSPAFKPFVCKITKDSKKPDAVAVKASRTDNKFSCGGGETIFLEGTNTHEPMAYCGVGGWFGVDNKMIMKIYKDKEQPYCMKETIFEDCSNNKCFTFKLDVNPKKLVKIDNKLDNKFGAYAVFDSDTTWRLRLQYKDIDLTSITIGKDKFDISGSSITTQLTSKVTATIIHEGLKSETGYSGKIIKFEAQTTDTDLMRLFGFYGANAVNEIKLEFGTLVVKGEGVANYDKYAKTSTTPFGGSGVASENEPDVTNLFSCHDGKQIYLDNEPTGLTDIRFTKKAWLKKDGTVYSQIKKDPSTNKEIIAAVYCFTVCNDAFITLTGDPKPRKTSGTTPVLEYTCGTEYVKVDTNAYSKITCQNSQWTGDGKAFDLSAAFTFSASCFGVSKQYLTCSKEEKTLGCSEVIESSGVLTCEPGFALTISQSSDEEKMYTSLTIDKNQHWMEGSTDLGKTEPAQKAQCYSKCKTGNVAVGASDDVTEVAGYTYDKTTKVGTLKCTGKNLLLSTVDGADKPYSELACDKDGWKEGNIEKKSFKAAKSVNDLKVKARCLKVCDDENIDKACPDVDNDCEKPLYASYKLTCPDTHVLYVNELLADKPLTCSSKGWTKDGDSTLFIDNNAIDLTKRTTARCISKCGKKFVTVNPPQILTSNTIACPGTDMISYTVGTDPAKDSLHDLTCDKYGWKDDTTLIPVAKNIKVECKPSCNEGLIKDDCSGQAHCVKANFKNNEWSCGVGHVLFAKDITKASDEPITCQKKTIGNAKISIDRTSPTWQATVSCYSICDDRFFAWPSNGQSKEKGRTSDGAFTRYCNNELHYIEIKYGATTKYSEEFQCTTKEPAEIMKNHLGENAVVECKDRCADRYKSSCGTGIACPSLANNKLTCDATRVMKIMNGDKPKYVFGNAIECKKDGFYENTEKVLSFAEDADDDMKLQFDISCISHCDNDLVKLFSNNPDTPGPVRTSNDLKCLPKQILLFDYKSKDIRVFSEAKCIEKAPEFGWQGTIAKDDGGTLTTTGLEGQIMKFDKNALLDATCVDVCNAKMVTDADTSTCASDKLCETANNGMVLKCNPDFRLFLNDKNADGVTGVTSTNEMKCTNQGWMEGDSMIVDYRNPDVKITEPVQAICKNKCHPVFISSTHASSCTADFSCSEAKYENKRLSCSDDTEILVLEHNGVIKESFSDATCSDKGWSNKKGELFSLADSQAIGFDFRIKARCEQLCAPTGVVDAGVLQIENSAGKNITCEDANMMLVLDDITGAKKEGVYSDMFCTKDGWKKVYKPDEATIPFRALDDASIDAAKERTQRKRKFTCALNDCMRPQSCKSSETNSCMELDLSQKYRMSCESPAQIALKDENGQGGSIYHSNARCEGGVWTSDTGELMPALSDEEKLKKIEERTAFTYVCSFAACTKCKEETLTKLQSSTDANFVQITFNQGEFKTCSAFTCGGSHYLIKHSSNKNKYFPDKEKKEFIKCHPTGPGSTTFKTPDDKQIIAAGTEIGCVKHIPCYEHRPLQTGCDGIKDGLTCDAKAFNETLKNGSMLGAAPVKCGTLGQMFYNTNAVKDGWKIVNELQCTATGEWRVKYLEKKDESATEKTIDKLPETMNDDAKTHPHFICAKKDPNPDAKQMDNDPETQTCSFCPYPPMLTCDDGCKKADDHATATNNGQGKCEMKIVNGRFKINGGEEIDKGTVLTCQMIDGKYPWMTPDGKKIDSLAVIIKDADNISKGAIAGIVIGVILVLGLLVFAMVYMAIRKRKEIERQEKLKMKGLEQKQDSIIDGATIVDDTKTLVL